MIRGIASAASRCSGGSPHPVGNIQSLQISNNVCFIASAQRVFEGRHPVAAFVDFFRHVRVVHRLARRAELRTFEETFESGTHLFVGCGRVMAKAALLIERCFALRGIALGWPLSVCCDRSSQQANQA
jgi:hypothetical protein